MRVAIYARYSTDKQSETSIEDQVRLCRARAQREGWNVVETYKDAAISGTSKERPAYLEMVSDALSGRFDLVLAEAMDPLARSLEETARLYNQLSFVDVKILTLSEGPVSEMNVSIGGLLGELYVKILPTRPGVVS